MPMYRVVTTDLLHDGELIREGGSVELTTREAAGKRYLERLPDPAPQVEPPQEEPAPEKPVTKARSRAKKRGGKS